MSHAAAWLLVPGRFANGPNHSRYLPAIDSTSSKYSEIPEDTFFPEVQYSGNQRLGTSRNFPCPGPVITRTDASCHGRVVPAEVFYWLEAAFPELA